MKDRAKKRRRRRADQGVVRMRIIFVESILIIAMCVLAGRSAQLQILKGNYYKKKVDSQINRVVKLTARRGEIVDRNGNVMAISLKSPSVYAIPKSIANKERVARTLASILNEDYKRVFDKINSQSAFVWVKRWVTPEQMEKVKSNFPPREVDIAMEYKRYYPNREVAAHILGFAGVDRDGLEGVEREYNNFLLPGDAVIEEKRDGKGRTIWLSTYREEDIQLVLTIDRDVQAEVERILERYVKNYGAKGGMAGFMNAKTGEVIAMAVYPYFNPNTFWEYSHEVIRNKFITDVYEPGSTFKVFLMSVALEEGTVSEDDEFYCENGRYSIFGKEIGDYKKFDYLTAKDIIVFSSNIGAVKIAEKLDKNVFYEYIRKFGFGSRTGIDLPGESGGLLKPLRVLTPFEYRTIAFGQGIGVTGIQMLTAFASVVNGGYLLKPYLVSSIRKNGKVVYKGRSVYYRKVISSQTSSRMKKILIEVVERGTGSSARIDGYYVGGKTGTSQKIDPITRTYSEDLYVASFIGFAPLSADYVGIVIIDEPKAEIYAGKVAAPAFAEMMKFILHRYNVPQERPFEVAKEE